MMDNLERVLSAFFKYVPVQEILAGSFSSANIKKEDFIRLMRFNIEGYSETELKNLYDYLVHNFKEQHYGIEKSTDKLDLFDLLRYYSTWILTEQENEIVCEYRKLLHWRMITNALSEDLFTTSFLSTRMMKNAVVPLRFDWKAVITHNNWELHRILKQGIAENHSHLKGSSTVFPLTWISLMNNIYSDLIYRQIEEIAQSRRTVNNSFWEKKTPLSVQLTQAACIRFLMFKLAYCAINKKKVDEELGKCCKKRCEKYCIWLQNPENQMGIRGDLSNDIHSIQVVFMGDTLPDYALAGVLEEDDERDEGTLIFQGERWLLYHFFYAIYSGTELNKYRDLFYAYLVLKENFRSEFIQNNKEVGFENFRVYEKRKDIFLENAFFKKEIVRKAIETSFAESKVMVMEVRIAPKCSAKAFYKYIRQMDEWLDDKRGYCERLFYTIHFIKQEDDVLIQEYMPCRHNRKRHEYIKQAFALVEFREKYPREAVRIKGIDAANMEIGCGPEVFAQVFRYLSDHRVMSEDASERKIPQLKKTYHVGEDFLDLISGLRSIDEAIHFLGMKCGDRLGHAIALGIAPEEWYQSKNDRILLSQQEYLDNVAWMYHWVVDCHLANKGNILNFLNREYEYYFQLIYRNAMDMGLLEHIRRKAKKRYKDTDVERYYNGSVYDFSIEKYYSAWELRGDDPELYIDGFFDRQSSIGSRYRSFSYYAVNMRKPDEQNKRYIQDIALLYYYYHYNGDVRREGEKIIEKKIDKMYIECAQMLQYRMQRVVAENGIGIETNPSSNVLIGTFKRYDKHPILNFYNKGLEEKKEKLDRCPQISVSINTDDAGIFGTSLENEYAYMALALEKAKDDKGNKLYKRRNIYDWLDQIRIMGLRQTFLDDEEMREAIQKWNGGNG